MRNMRSKASKQNKFLRIVTIPVRALRKARDSYVKGMTNYANIVPSGSGNFMCVQGIEQVHGLPKSYSVNSATSNNSEEYKELMRSASARNVGPSDLDAYVRHQMTMRSGSVKRSQPKPQPQPQPQPQPKAMPPRSRSVALGRIDEDSPCCYFGNQDNNISSVKNDFKYGRSRSHAVAR